MQRFDFTREQRIIVVLLFFVTFLNYLDRQILSVLAPVLREEIGLTPSAYAMVMNAFLLTYSIMSLGSGIILDRIGTRRGLGFFVVAWSLVCAMHSSVRTVSHLVVWRMLLGITEPGGWAGAVKASAERFTALQRGLVVGIFTSGAGVAMLVAPPLVVALSSTVGWRLTFLIPGLAGLFWLPVWLRATRVQAAQTASQAIPWREALPLLRNRRALGYLLMRCIGDSSAYFFVYWMPQYLIDQKGFSFAMLGAAGWIPYVANDAGPTLGGYLSSRLVSRGWDPLVARKAIMTLAAVIVSAGLYCEWGEALWAIILALSISMLGVGLWAGNMQALAADAFPQGVVARIYGLGGCVGSLGGMAFNTVTGYFGERGDYWTVFVVLVLLQPTAVSALWLWMRPEACERPSQPAAG